MLAETYPATQRWLDYCTEQAATRRHDALAHRRPEAADYETYHYSKGAVISFLHTHVVGLRAARDWPAYERFVVHPHVNGPLTWARATLDTPHGRIEAGWQRGDDSVEVSVTVPAGTSGVVRLPDGSERDVEVGVHTFTTALPPAG